MTLEELLQKLKDLKYSCDVFGKRDSFPVITLSEFGAVENLIRQYALDNHDAELGRLQAKVFAYEQIIANSNFAPMIIQEIPGATIDIGELARQGDGNDA